jgi:hypothetical protein
MEGKRFDQLVRALATRGSRRRVLGGFLAGTLGGLRIRPSAADDSGTTIADASGGNHNLASAVDQASSGQDHDHDGGHDNDHDNDHGDGGHGGAKPCPCFEGTCCRQNETCCNVFDQDTDEQIGLVCCDASTCCNSGACVDFCTLGETEEDGECCCPDDSNHCSNANVVGKFICCPWINLLALRAPKAS